MRAELNVAIYNQKESLISQETNVLNYDIVCKTLQY